MHVRKAKIDDLDAVVRLLRAQYEEHSIVLAHDVLVDAVRSMLGHPEQGAILVATATDDAVLGVAVLAYTWTLEHGGKVAWLDELFVVPEDRGRGIGGRLLGEAMLAAKDTGCRAVQLEVVVGHERAERLYRRAGFSAIARQRWGRSLSNRSTTGYEPQLR